MYEAFRGVDGPGAEAICSDIFKLLTVNYQRFKVSSLFTRYFDRFYHDCLPRGPTRARKSLYDLRTLTFFFETKRLCVAI